MTYYELLATLPPDCDMDEDNDDTCEEGSHCRAWYDCLVSDIAWEVKGLQPFLPILQWLLLPDTCEENSVYQLAEQFAAWKATQ